MKKFKIKSYGIDTSNLGYRPEETLEEEFIHISLRSGNSYLLESKISRDAKVICSIDYLDGIVSGITGLLIEIGRSDIEALLIGPGCVGIEKYIPDLAYLLDQGLVKNIGFQHPFDIVRLKETAEKIKQLIIPRYILLSISPVYFQKDIIDWAEGEGLTILGDNPLGGFLNSGRAITSFTVPYLLGFSSTYSDVVLLSSRDLITSELEEEYLEELIGKDCPDMYELEVSADHRVKKFKKMIYSSIDTGDYLLPFSDPSLLWSYSELKLGFSKGEPKITSEKLTPQEQEVFDFVRASHKFPEDGISIDYLGIVRPEICKQLREQGWKVEVAKLGDEVYILKLSKEVVEKRILRKSKVQEITKYLLLTIDSGELILCPYNQNSPLEN